VKIILFIAGVDHSQKTFTQPHGGFTMKQTKLLLAALFMMFLAVACQKENPVQAPAEEQASAALSNDAAAESELEARIQAHLAARGLAKSGAVEITGPTVITAPGVYRVADNFSATGDGIVIQSDYVLLNLDERTITGPGNKAGRGIVLDGVQNVVVRNGNLRTFGVGTALLGTSAALVRNVNLRGGDEVANPPAGIPPQIGVLLVNSYRNFIVGNKYRDVNLGVFVRGGNSFNNTIVRNTVSAGANGLLGICYNPAAGEGDAGPQNDFVAQNVLNRFGTGIQMSGGSRENRFTRNTIYYFNLPYEDFNGTNVFENNRTQQVTP
jgi:hypothetical protein